MLKRKKRDKSGKLKSQLGIKGHGKVTNKLIDLVVTARVGSIINNPSKSGNRKIKVTKLMARRAILTKNLRKKRK